MSEVHKVIIVGGGIAGLTTATALAKRGVSVLLIEKNNACGGLVNSFERNGYLFDGGIRAIENAGMIIPMLQELEIDLEMLKSDISIGVEHEIIGVETEDSIEDYEQMLNRLYPESHNEVGRIIQVVREMKEHMNVLFGPDSPFFKDTKRDKMYYVTSFVPWLFKLFRTFLAINKMKISVEDFLARIASDSGLVDIISQHFFKGTPAFFAMSYFALYTDYYYPKGGVGEIPNKLEKKFVDLGGAVLNNTDICRVDYANHSVRDQNGVDYGYEKLIWAADLKQLCRLLVPGNVNDTIAGRIEKDSANILSKKGAESVFTVFTGVDLPPEYFRRISHGHFFYTPSREGLGTTQRADLSNMLQNWASVTREDVLSWMDRFCRLNTYEISIPALHDAKAAPDGKTGVIISLLLDYELVKRVHGDGWYEEFKESMEDKILEVLAGSIYPSITDNLHFKFSATPLTVEKRVRSSEGAIVGWSFEQPVPVNPGMLNMKDSVKTVIPDVLKVGQWAASPAGLPTCILTAKLAADYVCKELG